MRTGSAIWRIALLGSLFLMMLCSGCTEEQITNVNIVEDPDTFTVSGHVDSYPQYTSVAGAEYEIMPGNITGVCDDKGYMEVTGLSAGNYQVTISATGYATSIATMTLTVPAQKGNNNQYRDFYLLTTSEDLDLTVRRQDTGGVMSGVSVAVVAVDFPYEIRGHKIDVAALNSTGQTDENGQVVLSGVPAVRVWVAANAYDIDDDGVVDFGALTSRFDIAVDAPNTGHMVMGPYTGEAPTVVATNVPSSYGTQVTAPALYYVFSEPMQTTPDATQVRLVQDNSPYEEIPLTVTWTSAIRLEFTPVQPLWDANRDYDLTLTVYSMEGDQFNTSTNSIYWQTGSDPVGGNCEDMVTDLVAESPNGAAVDYDSRTILLSWTAVPCAGGYRVYARDDRNNQQWIHLKDEPTDYEMGSITTVCSLPESFDRYDIDGIQTPFAGTDVSFSVVPMNATSPNPGAPHGTVIVSDSQAPAILYVTQIGNGLNATGSSTPLEFVIQFSEYVDPSVVDPVIEMNELGGDPAFVLNPANAFWSWTSGGYSGRFIFDLPDGTNASGDQFRVTVNDLADLSGNTIAGVTASPWKTIEIWGAIFNFEGSPQGWTQTGDGWQWGTPTIGPLGAHDGVRCWGVSMNANYGDNWVADLRSSDIFVPGVNPVLNFWCWYDTDYYDDYVYVYADNGITEVLLDTFHGNSGGWQLKSYSLDTFLNETVTLRFRFTSDNYGTYPGFFVDDVIIDNGLQ